MDKEQTKLDMYLENLEPDRLKDVVTIIDIARDITKKEPIMWGTMIGFGKIHYQYASKRQGDTFEFGLASRKQALTLYLGWDVTAYEGLKQLGKHKAGKGCLYIKKLSDVNLDVLKSMIKQSVDSLRDNPIITHIE